MPCTLARPLSFRPYTCGKIDSISLNLFPLLLDCLWAFLSCLQNWLLCPLLTCGSISLDLFFPSIGTGCSSSPSVGPGVVGVGFFYGVASISFSNCSLPWSAIVCMFATSFTPLLCVGVFSAFLASS